MAYLSASFDPDEAAAASDLASAASDAASKALSKIAAQKLPFFDNSAAAKNIALTT